MTAEQAIFILLKHGHDQGDFRAALAVVRDPFGELGRTPINHVLFDQVALDLVGAVFEALSYASYQFLVDVWPLPEFLVQLVQQFEIVVVVWRVKNGKFLEIDEDLRLGAIARGFGILFVKEVR